MKQIGTRRASFLADVKSGTWIPRNGMYLAKGSEQLELTGYRAWDGRNVTAPPRGAAMSKKTHVHLSDLAGLKRMATDITVELTDLVDALHKNIACSPIHIRYCRR